jgi:TonB family protein
MNWWQYLLLVNLYLILFYSFYALLLRRETFFQLNRIYLVSSALLSFFIPLIQAGWVQNLFITQRVEYTIYSNPVIIHGFKPVGNVPLNFGQLFAGLYLAGVAFWAIKLTWQLITLNKIIKKPMQDAPCSFFKKIEVNEQDSGSHIINAHEQVHAKQWHSADVLIIEAVMIINWFNPVVYFYRRAIKHIHEFIADSEAIKTADSKAEYALLLLTQTFNAPQHQLVNHFFNKSLLKQRIIMLQKDRSQRIKLVKYGLSAPLFMLMLILSSATVNNSKAVTIINKKAAQVFAAPAITSITIVPAADMVADKKSPAQNATVVIVPPQTGNTAFQNTDTTQINKEPVFAAVEQEPEFIGGSQKFTEFLAANIKYPPSMAANNLQGKAIVTFIIEKDGSLSNVKALTGPNKDAEDEAVRVVTLTSGKWMPGLQNHQYVRVQYTVPISFALEGKVTGMTVAAITPDSGIKRVSFIRLGTLTANDPLYILDGKEITAKDMKLLNPGDIESISVLKDQSAKLIYGAKGTNGVIIITTKKANATPDKTPQQK